MQLIVTLSQRFSFILFELKKKTDFVHMNDGAKRVLCAHFGSIEDHSQYFLGKQDQFQF